MAAVAPARRATLSPRMTRSALRHTSGARTDPRAGSVFWVHGREGGILRTATAGDGRKALWTSLAGWASGCWARLRRGFVHLCDPCPRASVDSLRRERDEDRVRSSVGASGERPHRRPYDRTSGVRRARVGDAAILRSADLLASGSNRPRRLDAARVRNHRIDAARRPANVHERGRAPGLRRFGYTRSLGRRDHRDRVESSWYRSPRPQPRRRRRLRNRRSRLVAAPRPLHPHHRAPVRVPHRLRHRVPAAPGRCGKDRRKPSLLPHRRNEAQHA